MINLHQPMRWPVDRETLDGPLLDAWFELNYRLQEEAVDTQITKPFVEQWMARLWTIASPRPQCFWLFLSRINELALLCASRYVDCCDFAAADEFLVEPGSVILRVESGKPKFGNCNIRRAALSPYCAVSLREERRSKQGGKQVMTEKEPAPLLPRLYHLLKGSGYMTEGYLSSVSRRTEKISGVARMLSDLGMRNTEDISLKLSIMDLDQRRNFRSRLCLFDRKTFNELGRALHLFMQSGKVDENYVGKYLLE